MKKLLAMTVVMAMAVSALAGCGSTTEAPAAEAPAAEAPEAEAPAAEEPAADEAVGGAEDVQDSFRIGICQLLEHPALDLATKGFQEALTEKLGDKVSFDFQNAQGEQTNAATICNGFVSDNVDLILANATAPLQAAAAATNSIPILGTSITDYATALDIADWTGVVGTNVSGTSDLAPLDKQEEMLAELFPDVKKVGILYCSAEANSEYQAKVFEQYLDADGIPYQEYTIADSNEIQSVVTAATESCDVLYIPTDNTLASNTELVNNICLPAKVPVIAGEEGICAGCGVATLSISYYDIGYKAGEMAYDILVNGADISQMAVEGAPQVTKKYNVSICEELGVAIPDDYEAIEAE